MGAAVGVTAHGPGATVGDLATGFGVVSGHGSILWGYYSTGVLWCLGGGRLRVVSSQLSAVSGQGAGGGLDRGEDGALRHGEWKSGTRMKRPTRDFYVLIERDEDGFYVGEAPQLRGRYV